MLNKHPNFFLPLFKQFDTNKSIKKGLLFNCVLISNFSEIGSNIREFFLNVRKKVIDVLSFYLKSNTSSANPSNNIQVIDNNAAIN